MKVIIMYIFNAACILGRCLSCQVCEKWFTTKSTLLKHQIWHHKLIFSAFKFNCSKCPYATNVLTHMKRHASVHDAERPYQCTTCGNRFTALNSLNNHMLIHTGEELNLFNYSA